MQNQIQFACVKSWHCVTTTKNLVILHLLHWHMSLILCDLVLKTCMSHYNRADKIPLCVCRYISFPKCITTQSEE